MSPAPLRRSLLLRLGLAMVAIAGLALFGIISSVVIAELLRGQATAINQAGALRMQTYFIGTRLLEQDPALGAEQRAMRVREAMARFEERKLAHGLTNSIPAAADAEIRVAYTHIVTRWTERVRPLLEHSLAAPPGTPSPDLTATLDDFVNLVDHFVLLLEQDTEAKIHALRLIQGTSLLLTLAVIYVIMYLMHTEVLTRLRDLLDAAESVRQGNLGVRIDHTGEDELGKLGAAFNVMAEDLSRMYADLEARVQRKTAELARSNRSLEVLYNTLAHLNAAAPTAENYARSLQELERFLGVGPSHLCLVKEDGGPGYQMATSARQPRCEKPDCKGCIKDGTTLTAALAPTHGRTLSIPLKDRDQLHGMLMIRIPGTLENWQIQLIEAVGRHIGVSLGSHHRLEQTRRLALLEERGAIARELHDSLAQSLSYLKIQVSRLQALPHGEAHRADREAVILELREGLGSAYRELRELITTFRLKMDGRGLAAALAETVADIADRGGLPVDFNNRLPERLLTVNQEIHVLQIAREALANVVQHAQASHAWVNLGEAAPHHILLTITDNGVGFDEDHAKLHHYGLTIMQERARTLGGTVAVQSSPQGGTRVSLYFPQAPAALDPPALDPPALDSPALDPPALETAP